MPVYDEKYMKAKVREFDGVVETNFLGDEIPKVNMHYACTICISTDSVMRIKKEELSSSLFGRMEIQNEKNKDV